MSSHEIQHSALASRIQWQCPIIITSRLYLRPALYRDASALTDILKDPDVSGKIAIFQQPYEHEDSINLCRLSEENSDGGKGWFMSIFLRSSNQQIGYILLPFDFEEGCGFLMESSLLQAEDRVLPKSGEVGYWLKKEHWGQGYASEALDALLTVAFDYLPIDYIHASTATYNEASKNVLLREGFIQDPEVFMRLTVMGVNRPSNNFKITAEQWRHRCISQRPVTENNTKASFLQHDLR